MASIVSVVVADPPIGDCIPLVIQKWLQNGITLNQSGLNNSQRIIVATTAPGPDDRDTLWHKISNTGISLGLFVYNNGFWRRFPTTPIGARLFYNGPITGVFDATTFMGLPGTEWDGWKIDFTFANRFPVIGNDYNAQLGVWQTTVGGGEQQQGGFANVTLDLANVPVASTPGVLVYLHARGNPGVGDFVLWGDQSAAGGLNSKTVIPATPGNLAPDSFQILPPFVSMAMCVYIGIAPVLALMFGFFSIFTP